MAYTESGANINATWQICDQIMVVADGQVSTLTLTDGAGSSSATFVGTISHTNPLTATTPLLCYVKDQNNPSAVTVNADGTYTYTSGAFLSQDGTMASAAVAVFLPITVMIPPAAPSISLAAPSRPRVESMVRASAADVMVLSTESISPTVSNM